MRIELNGEPFRMFSALVQGFTARTLYGSQSRAEAEAATPSPPAGLIHVYLGEADDWSLRLQSEVAAWAGQAQAFADGCGTRNPALIAHIGTRDSARDMESIRIALAGAERLARAADIAAALSIDGGWTAA